MIFGIIGLAILSFPSLAQNNEGYEITGSLEGLKEGQKVILMSLYYGSWRMDHIDSAYVKNGAFHLTGVVPEGPREFMVALSGTGPNFHLILANGDKVTVQGNRNLDVRTFHHSFCDDYITVYGSPYTTSLRNMLPAWFFYDRTRINLKKYANQLADSLGFDGAKINEVFESINQLNKSFRMEVFNRWTNQTDSELVIAHPLLVWSLLESSGRAPFLVEAYNELAPECKNSYVAKVWRDYNSLCIGQPFPPFTLNNPDGKPLSSKDIFSKSKMTIVHFWADGSVYQKKMQDELRLLYKKYHDRGLNIIGVSSDKYGDQWRDALSREQFPWYNVSDLKGKEGVVENVYHEYGDPKQIRNTTNVLVDPQGKIVAWDVEGTEMHWYLWKAFGE